MAVTGGEALRRDVRICFVGDSFVNGSGDPRFVGWTGRVCASALARGFAVTHYDLGVRRDTSAEILLRWREECRRRLPEAADGRVVFSFGVNDADLDGGVRRLEAKSSVANARRLWEEAAAEFPVLMVGPPPVADDGHNARIAELCLAMGEAAAAAGIGYLRVYDALRASEAWMAEAAANDGSHPRAAGYEVLAACVQKWPRWWFARPARGIS